MDADYQTANYQMSCFQTSPARCTWMVPLYGHADFLHDYIVQSPGAFDETIDGLLTLHDV